ncbi:SDR family oxidoreductase [Heyndrickxia oleronia]|jgi:short-subunit dehydrogenase|uniref:Oxidoreductase n=1 Tax=Heyndrickxia oleronia TaxID=38875 RepID=A0A8E2LFX4_9BACI|nr:SDR family oxidoreductase [Heyndrickxia oleronia]NYV65995.1 SDR family oxidoreductase [Bacillus sp. Gen3]MCM3453610.1 SDR family oxidoreductase [Heyndrickxia oleronia]MEC1374897.1 SDR family oxidoreductase [Heyndrickxia oleronia]OOP69833.1 oxidoreductase [Heyndrickxia oleronia]QQZ06674.1 SDR family oxidoreductase [Heyndrickxia oleronia]
MANQRLRNKTIVITGASGGLGEQIAFSSAKNGANVILLARNIKRLEGIKQEIEENYKVQCDVHYLDVSNHEQVSKVFQRITEENGDIDVLVNNAGYGIFEEAHTVSIEHIKGMFDVNVLGLMACTKEVMPQMRKKRYGHIINIASQAGKMATPKSSIYAATKHAVLGYSNSIRMELSLFDVFVTTVNPGPIATNFFSIADQSGTYVKNVERFMLNPEKLANQIVDSMLTNKREINAPKWMNAGSIIYTLFPRLVERVGRKAFFKK